MGPEEWELKTHKAFVEAIFMEGMRRCSPSVILKNMTLQAHLDDEVTLERVKSHLQKFRSNKKKSLSEFLFSYDIALATYCRFLGTDEKDEISSITKTCSMSDLDQLSPAIAESKKGVLLSGEVAAYLTLASILSPKGDVRPPSKSLPPDISRGTDKKENPLLSTNSARVNNGDLALSNPPMFMMYCSEGHGPMSLQFPTLTDDEKDGPLGALMCYVLGNFSNLLQLIMKNRNEKRHGDNLNGGNKFVGKESIVKRQNNSASLLDTSQQNPTSNSQDPPLELVEQVEIPFSRKRSTSNLSSRSETYIRRDIYGIPYLPQASVGISSGSSSDTETLKQFQVGSILDHSQHSLNYLLNDELAVQIQRSFDSPRNTQGNAHVEKDSNIRTTCTQEKREKKVTLNTTNTTSQDLRTFKANDYTLSCPRGSSNTTMPHHSKEVHNRKIHDGQYHGDESSLNYDFMKQTINRNASHSHDSYPTNDKSGPVATQVDNEANKSYRSNSYKTDCDSPRHDKRKRSSEGDNDRYPKSHKR